MGQPVYKYNHVAIPFSKEMMDDYKTKITENIYGESPLMKYLNKEKEKEMSDIDIVNKVINERKEAKTKEVVEYLDGHFGSIDYDNGDLVTWNVIFNDGDKEYCYAAIRGGRKWYITHDREDYTTEELIAKIAELALRGDVWFDGADDPL
jgi:hypothetical protein